MSNPEKLDISPTVESQHETVETPTAAEQAEPTIEERLQSVESLTAENQEAIAQLEAQTSKSKEDLRGVRERLGLSDSEDNTDHDPTASSRLESLRSEQAKLEQQKEELVTEQEKAELIQQEKKKVLQEKLDGLFEEFNTALPEVLNSLAKNGKTPSGEKYSSKNLGELSPESAQSLAEAFKQGVKLLPEILKVIPELLKEFDEQITKEAESRVEERIEKEMENLREEAEKPDPENLSELEKTEEADDGETSNPPPSVTQGQTT